MSDLSDAYRRFAELPLRIERYELEGLARPNGPSWTRHTTLVHLVGGGERGTGEDVTYDGDDQRRFQAEGGTYALTGDFTLASFSTRLDGVDPWPAAPQQPASRAYRRWALESAALDLALRQARTSFESVLGRAVRPLSFVASLGPESFAPIAERLERVPDMRFKLDARENWTRPLMSKLAATGAITTVDLKGAYHGTPVDLAPDAALYERVFASFPGAWIEDPALTAATRELCAAHRERITWDAPLHSLDDVRDLPWKPRAINVKPSRFGTLSELLRVYQHCEANGIAMYGGGQFELGCGRDQVQLLAALFHPDGPNDTAPVAYNASPLPADLPPSPLTLEPRATGFALAGQP